MITPGCAAGEITTSPVRSPYGAGVPAPSDDTAVLWALLGQPPASGFEICATVASATGRRCTPRRLLPSLIRLEDAGLVAVDRTGDPYRYVLTVRGTTAAYDSGPGRPEPAVLVMADLVGFTRFTERHGDGAAHEQASRLTSLARSAARAHGGAVVKSLGDGVLLRLPPQADPVPVLHSLASGLAAGEPSWQLHAAAHRGTPLRHGGDVFGRDVNLVARLCSHAGPGELLVTGGDEAMALEGFDDPVHVQRVVL